MTTYYEEKEINGEPCFRTVEGGAWTVKLKVEPIDSLLQIVQQKLKLKSKRMAIEMLGLDTSGISRIRTGQYKISAKVILLIYDITGLSIEDIRRIGCIDKLL